MPKHRIFFLCLSFSMLIVLGFNAYDMYARMAILLRVYDDRIELYRYCSKSIESIHYSEVRTSVNVEVQTQLLLLITLCNGSKRYIPYAASSRSLVNLLVVTLNSKIASEGVIPASNHK
jgi:hypothetical protein